MYDQYMSHMLERTYPTDILNKWTPANKPDLLILMITMLFRWSHGLRTFLPYLEKFRKVSTEKLQNL